MPILTAQAHIVSLLTDLPLPGQGGSVLQADVVPLDPDTDQVRPHAFIWPADGPEARQSLPRPQKGTPGTGSTQAGWKEMAHHFDIWLTWFQDQGDPTRDTSFPVIVDAVMDALRCATDPVQVQDPETFRWSTLFAIGEQMTYSIDPPRSTRNMRELRYDGRVSLTAKEAFQA